MDESCVILARHPILATDGSVFGYELLYRGSPLDCADHCRNLGFHLIQTTIV